MVADEHAPPGPDAGPPQSGSPEDPWAPPSGSPTPSGVRPGWTGGRIATLVIGSLLALISLAALALGGAATWLQTHRDGGYVSSGSRTLTTPGYALSTGKLGLGGGRWRLLGTLRVRATGLASTTRVFLGVTTANQASHYLTGVRYTTVNSVFAGTSGRDVFHDGGALQTSPVAAGIWAAQQSGIGTQTLVWPVKGGDWTIVAMNAGGSPSVTVHASVGATFPPLPWLALGLDVGGVLLLAASVVLIIIPVRRATRRS